MPPPPVTIRPAVAEDYDALCELWLELDEHHRRQRPELFRPPQGAGRDRDWALAQIDGDDRIVLVAQAADGQLAGLAYLRIETPEQMTVRIVRRHVQLDNLVVGSAFRRRGVARELVRAAARWTAAQDLSELELTVLEFNATALEFYAAAGFRTIRRRLSLPVGPAAKRPDARAVGAERHPC